MRSRTAVLALVLALVAAQAAWAGTVLPRAQASSDGWVQHAEEVDASCQQPGLWQRTPCLLTPAGEQSPAAIPVSPDPAAHTHLFLTNRTLLL